MDTILVAIVGPPGVGKGVVADRIAELLREMGYRGVSQSGWGIREVCYEGDVREVKAYAPPATSKT